MSFKFFMCCLTGTLISAQAGEVEDRLAEIHKVCPQIAYARHAVMGGSHYAYTEAVSDAQRERTFIPGSELCILTINPDGSTSEEVVLKDEGGIIRDVDISYDAKRLLFAWKKHETEDDFSLYEMDLATRQIRQITNELGVADYEGCYLPDGKIMFNSTRCIQTVDCWWTEVSNLYTMNPDGSEIQRICYDQVHVNYPTITADGRVIYTRWEYNDRAQVYPQPLFAMNPDGTNQRAIYGENSWFPTSILHARAVPNSSEFIAVASGHHTLQVGELILVDPTKGRQEADGVKIIAPQKNTEAIRLDKYGQDGPLYLYPYPITKDDFFVVSNPDKWPHKDLHHKPDKFDARKTGFDLYLMDRDGKQLEVVSGDRLSIGRPVPIIPREIPNRASIVDRTKKDGVFYIQDVYVGTSESVKRGTIKYIRAVALDYRTSGIGSLKNIGPGGGGSASTPVSIGNGTWDPKIILGDVPVEEDGSVSFTAPANVPIYFMLLDENKRMVHTMRSWTVLQPNETASCVGCHEPADMAPTSHAVNMALKKAPQQIQPFQNVSGKGFSFAENIQPILDQNCIKCHNEPREISIKETPKGKEGRKGKKKAVAKKQGKPNLTSTEVVDQKSKRRWMQSYLELTHLEGEQGDNANPILNWHSAASTALLVPPYTAGSNTSKIIKMLEEKHGKTDLSKEEIELFSAWIDLSVPFCGTYSERNDWTDKEMEKYKHFTEKRKKFATPGEIQINAF